MDRKSLNLKGQRFKRLIVIAKAGKNKWNRSLWWCLCSCGEYTIVSRGGLKKGDTRSCGCLKREFAGKHIKTHGQSNTKVYWVWANMKARCFYGKHIEFENYGGRGIIVCDRWLDFGNFISDMGPRPKGKYTIERIDNNGNYEPKNCIWLLQSINNQNKRIYKNNTTGCKGVYWDKFRKKYVATINRIYLGIFENLQDAIDIRKAAEIKYQREI